MATYTILSSSAPYYTVRIEFDEHEFDQQIFSAKTGAALNTMLQAYADSYAAEWRAALPVDTNIHQGLDGAQ